MMKYKILCIENPLQIYTGVSKEESSSSVVSVQTLRDCIDLLWTETAGKEVLEKIDDIIQKFLVANERLEFKSLQKQRDLVGNLYSSCLQIVLLDSRLRVKTANNRHLLQNIKTSIESYIHHAIYKKLIKGITACTACEDANFNKIVRNLSDLQLQDLEVRSDLYDTVPKAKAQIARIDCYCTVLGKISCLQRTFAAISKCDASNSSYGNVLSADDLLPMLVFLVIKSGLPNWIAHVTYMKLFNFSASLSHQIDQGSFLVTSLEAAIEHIKSGLLQGPSEPEGQLNLDGAESDSGGYEMYQGFGIPSSIDRLDSKTRSATLSNLFELARQGNAQELEKLLTGKGSETDDEMILLNAVSSLKLCHPLCSCDKCERVLSQNLLDTTPTIHSCDDRGYTILHVASMYGRPKVVDVLISCGANPNSTDYSGSTPLHYAAARGHQNALLLLIHAGAKVDKADNEGNMPLHLSAGNGHEGCIKAILYYTEHVGVKLDINMKNRHGETALHNAARWGYQSIVKILLEYGACPSVENKRKLTPLDYAHSLHISKLLMSWAKRTIANLLVPKFENSISNHKQDMTVAAASKPLLDFNDEGSVVGISREVGIRPQTTDQIKQIERLLRAIAYGDVQLACFYLGLVLPDREEMLKKLEKTHSCHPLCSCKKLVRDDCEDEGKCVVRSENIAYDVCDSDGFTPLHVSVMHGQIDLVKMLIDVGAKINLRTRTKNKTPLHLACENGQNKIAQLLLSSGICDVNCQDAYGNSPLHYACLANNTQLVQILLNYKPNLNLRNSNGKTAQKEAEDRMSLSMLRLLTNASGGGTVV
ncbi:ankyrin repeat domain-containing protein 27-like [Nilaparvata lugens]|uniref:ankyrin repeat domain-containing protein 27-like n=1 Tax=Nilaparvata lugens TaxID=108931 RepID=UPI00193DCDD7|nr:ankyrin repeat domain-containing protein 27-like [Nilaparvata lugens]